MEDLRTAICDRNLEDLLSELLFERLPFAFSPSWDEYRGWRRHLATAINVDSSEIVIVGSAAVGYSLSPIKNLKAFDSDSDIDVAVVSDHFFSEAWHHLRTVDLAIDPLTPPQRAAVIDHQKRYIYWGCIATDRILPIMPFAQTWMSARAQLSGMAPTADRDINFRIYKDFRALRTYQMQGLKRLRDTLLNSENENATELS